MRIDKGEQDSRIRVSDVKIAVHHAILKCYAADAGLQDEEVLQALAEEIMARSVNLTRGLRYIRKELDDAQDSG